LRIVRRHQIIFEINGKRDNQECLPLHIVRTLEIEVNQKDPEGIPLILGDNVQQCPVCGDPLSFAYGHYFCRNRQCSNYNAETSGN
jgi:hypothetical protein